MSSWRPPTSATPDPPIPPAQEGYGYVKAPFYGYVQSTLEAPLRKYEDLPTPKYGDENGPKRNPDSLPPRPPDIVMPPPAQPAIPPAPPPAVTPIGPVSLPQAEAGGGFSLAGMLAPVRNIPNILGRATANAAARTTAQGVALQATATGIKGLRPTMGGVLWQALNPAGLLRSTGISALIAAPIALIENLIEHSKGKTTTNQLVAGTVADTLGYTAAGVGGTVIGAMIGSVVPGIGTLVGMAAGGLLSALYSKFIRPKAKATVEARMFG
ncbi:MAG: hypothetical protein FJZ00_11170 [Candidatus Sericytochromatia bacterium]|uniref:Uncharacterized protein n=1 Tax=Candidatus Tanganyikabacteria bacterium TaxID=2961651 RepID=A0A938BP05_9BACT|nr:hypothetical protein [Candidatus Tanganyikabacteria bacterium]